VRVLALRLQPHQIDDVDNADFQFGQVLAQDGNRREISSVGVAAAPITTSGSPPWSLLATARYNAFRAMHYSGFHAEPLRQGVFAGHDHVT